MRQMNIIFPGGEVTDLIIANVETLMSRSRRQQLWQLFFRRSWVCMTPSPPCMGPPLSWTSRK